MLRSLIQKIFGFEGNVAYIYFIAMINYIGKGSILLHNAIIMVIEEGIWVYISNDIKE